VVVGFVEEDVQRAVGVFVNCPNETIKSTKSTSAE
jgi:hypothetical protein